MNMNFNPSESKQLRADTQPAAVVIVIASSAGGIHALLEVITRLPGNLKAGVVVVQHLDPHHKSMISQILNRQSNLLVRQASDGDMVTARSVFIAPPDWHLVINPDRTLGLSQQELELFVRPSANLLFTSAAESFGKNIIAVVLTGTGKDGADGVVAVKKAGGMVIAQNEETSEFFGMPGAAIHTGCVDFVLPLNEIADKIVGLIPGA
jgi:two-component system, chemotaxis family, protein-glutamate methylesterase/glutaminase